MRKETKVANYIQTVIVKLNAFGNLEIEMDSLLIKKPHS